MTGKGGTVCAKVGFTPLVSYKMRILIAKERRINFVYVRMPLIRIIRESICLNRDLFLNLQDYLAYSKGLSNSWEVVVLGEQEMTDMVFSIGTDNGAVRPGNTFNGPLKPNTKYR